MATVKVDLDDLAATLADDVAKLRPAVIREIQIAVGLHGPALAASAIARARPRQPVDRGTYRRGFRTQDLENGVVFYNPVKYAGVIEEGRRPGRMPPVGVLAAWVRRKGISRDASEARQIAFAIARKMARDGWPSPPNEPMRIMEKVARGLEPEVERAIDRAMDSI